MKRTALFFSILAVVALSACARSEDPSVPGAQAFSGKKSGKTLVRPEKIQDQPKPIPQFDTYRDVREKKSAFFNYMNAKVQVANDDVWAERLFVIALREKFMGSRLKEKEVLELAKVGESYDLDWPEQIDEAYFDELLVRVDVVPAALALAQAANESAWGTSRFAREGRNFFGIWCYKPGCGIPPARRSASAKHEVRKFRSVLDGIRFYIHNINTSHAYRELRDIRADIRREDERLTGAELARGLTRYSERGAEYVSEIRAMIRQNNLSRYTVPRTLTPLTASSTL